MTKVKKLLCLVMAVITVLSILSIPASAKKAKAPISLCVMTDRTSCGYLGVITVTITLKNISDKDLKNVVITSSESDGLVTYRPVVKNVLITNPCATPLRKKDSITTCLKPGGMMKYTYCVLLGYKYSYRKIPESTSILMAKQHRLLDTKMFREVKLLKGGYVSTKVNLAFCDVPTKLVVKAYYNADDGSYDALAAGENVVETTTTTTAAPRETTTRSYGGGSVTTTTRAVPTTTSPSVTTTTAAAKDEKGRPAFDKDVSSKFVVNIMTKTFHRTDWDCGNRPTENKTELAGSYNTMVEKGFVPCPDCFG